MAANELKLKDDVRRAERADKILNDQLVKEALNNIKQALYFNIESSSWRSRGEREECYRMLKVVARFQKEFEDHIRNGKVAGSRLTELLMKVKR